jgi:hypothetical protein
LTVYGCFGSQTPPGFLGKTSRHAGCLAAEGVDRRTDYFSRGLRVITKRQRIELKKEDCVNEWRR